MAVGNSYEITMIFIAFATGCNMACSVITSQLCVALMIFGMLSSQWILQYMNTPAEIYGDSRTPFMFLAISSILNIGVNLLFVGGLHMGVAVTAGYAAGIKLSNLVITAFTTLGNGISNFAAHNIGAGKLDRVPMGHRAGIQMVWTVCVPVELLYTFGGKALIGFFIDNPTALAVDSGAHFLCICTPFYFLISVKLATDGILRGAGMMKEFVIATTLDLILRVVLVQILAGPFGYLGIWAAWPIGWILGTSLSLMFYKKKRTLGQLN